MYRVAPDSFNGYPAAGYPVFFYRIPDIRPRYPATGYPVMAGYPAGYRAKSALNNKFLPECRAFNYQIQYTVITAGISTFYSILTIRGSKLNLKKNVFFDHQSFLVEFHKVFVQGQGQIRLTPISPV